MRNTVYDMFGRSPIRPLQQHMTHVHSCISELNDFMVAIHAKDWEEAENIRSIIGKKENEADKIKKDLRLNLPSTFMMPFSRRDLLDLLLIQDSIANKTKDVSGLISDRKMILPGAITKDVIKLTDVCIQTSAMALKAVNELDALVETGFSKRGGKVVSSIIKKVNKLESESDKIQSKIRNKIFPIEGDFAPVDVMFYYRAIEWLGELADSAQKVGSRLEVLLAR